MRFMSLTQRNIMILGLIVTIAIGLYPYSSNLAFFQFTPPTDVNYNSGSSFTFKLHNYGEKAGLYEIQISSEEFLVKIGNSLNQDYKHEDTAWTYIEDGDDHSHRVYLKASESNLPINATVKFTYLDKSPFIFKKSFVWDFYYELDDSGRYKKYTLRNETSYTTDFIIINNNDFYI